MEAVCLLLNLSETRIVLCHTQIIGKQQHRMQFLYPEGLRQRFHSLLRLIKHMPVIPTQLLKEYYSCFPLLLQMGILLVNHCMLATGSGEPQKILEEARASLSYAHCAPSRFLSCTFSICCLYYTG